MTRDYKEGKMISKCLKLGTISYMELLENENHSILRSIRCKNLFIANKTWYYVVKLVKLPSQTSQTLH
jgi:hypothetical protein